MRHNFLSFWVIFCLFNLLSPNSPENQNFEEIKKTFGDVFILSLCNKKHHLLMYAYSDMEWSHRYFFFFSFQTSFRSFAPLLIPKIKIWKKYKKTPGDIILLYMCTINQDHMHPWDMMYGSWEIKFNRQAYFVILGNFLSFFPPNSPKTENFKKRK